MVYVNMAHEVPSVHGRLAFVHFLQLAMTSFAHFLQYQLHTNFAPQSGALSDKWP